ncbi:hypothetical protein [Olivibacter sitiensis]|uniref:hypothetical protein n=1 Tax=Olivibacter sitiensis TaxID=376470 RepID=UPI00041AEA38|nr:hypothetical protein [Olivibacter sitiensis]
MSLKQRWLLALIFLVLQTIVSYFYINIGGVDDIWTYLAWGASAFVAILLINFLFSLFFTSIAALVPKKDTRYRLRFKMLFPYMICVSSVIVSMLLVLTDYID